MPSIEITVSDSGSNPVPFVYIEVLEDPSKNLVARVGPTDSNGKAIGAVDEDDYFLILVGTVDFTVTSLVPITVSGSAHQQFSMTIEPYTVEPCADTETYQKQLELESKISVLFDRLRLAISQSQMDELRSYLDNKGAEASLIENRISQRLERYTDISNQIGRHIRFWKAPVDDVADLPASDINNSIRAVINAPTPTKPLYIKTSSGWVNID